MSTPTIFHGRRVGRVVAVWAVAIAAELALHWFIGRHPALRAILAPLYALIVLPAIAATWHWLRPRQDGDRRHEDRRHLDRRDESLDESGGAP